MSILSIKNVVYLWVCLNDLSKIGDSIYDWLTNQALLRPADKNKPTQMYVNMQTHVTLDHKTSLKGQFLKIKMYT